MTSNILDRINEVCRIKENLLEVAPEQYDHFEESFIRYLITTGNYRLLKYCEDLEAAIDEDPTIIIKKYNEALEEHNYIQLGGRLNDEYQVKIEQNVKFQFVSSILLYDYTEPNVKDALLWHLEKRGAEYVEQCLPEIANDNPYNGLPEQPPVDGFDIGWEILLEVSQYEPFSIYNLKGIDNFRFNISEGCPF